MDTNKNGRIGKDELMKGLALWNLQIDPEDVNVMFMFLDLDGSNSIEYNEFLRKLRRAGVKVRRTEEQCLYDIYNIITNEGLTIREVYEAFDTNHDN